MFHQLAVLGRQEGTPQEGTHQGGDFGEWFIRWLDLIGEYDQARGRLIDDETKVAVLLKRFPRNSETILFFRVRKL